MSRTPSTLRVPPGAALPYGLSPGVIVTLSAAPTNKMEVARIAGWVADLRAGATIHWAPDGTLWDDIVDEADIARWTNGGEGPGDHMTLTCWVSADDAGLLDAADLLPLLLADHGPLLFLDIGPAAHDAEIARLQALPDTGHA
ncbi:MAG: hypothetical protein WBA67_03345 [Jannaschia sp.]